jgi:putative restriction endonuclease
MTEEQLKQHLQQLTIWKKGDQRAPHKPLLVLYALAKYQSEKVSILPYEEVKPKLKELLMEFGPRRRSYAPEEPFVRLTGDGIWQLDKVMDHRDPRNKLLLKENVKGGFTEEVRRLFDRQPLLLKEAAELLLHEHFPETMHEDILDAVGLDMEMYAVSRKRRARDPRFRDKILRAYEYRCAVCGFNVRIGSQLVGIEAAHIKWHQMGGPDTEENGMALCSLHHKLFDRGVFTITPSRILLVAEEANGSAGFQEWLLDFHGREISAPVRPAYKPDESFIHWHVKEVFKGPERYVIN